MPINHSYFGLLTRKLVKTPGVTADDMEAVVKLSFNVREIKMGADVVREGDRPTQCCLLVSGVLYRAKIIAKGKRQIVSFHLPNDIPDLQSLHLDVADDDLTALTASVVAYIPLRELKELMSSRPNLSAFFWREALIDASIFREWVVNVGRRQGLARIAHLLCEHMVRLRAIGAGDRVGFSWPFTQDVIGDATGLTSIHVNRVLKDLKSLGLIEVNRRKLSILDWRGLSTVADFRHAYLHLREPVTI